MKRVSKMLAMLSILLALVMTGSSCIAQETEVTVLKADFSSHTGVPYFKRQNLFSVSYSFGLGGDSTSYLKSVGTLNGLRSENMRVDLSMGNGGLGKYFAQGTIDNMRNEFFALDMLMKKLYENGTAMYLSYGYMPQLLQEEYGTFRSAPCDYDAWERLCYDIASHYRNCRLSVQAHEIWNEPDLKDGKGKKVFYSGTWQEYIMMYDRAVTGIRRADPFASVGGLSLAFVNYFPSGDAYAFFDHVKENGLPLDFVSFHNYGTSSYRKHVDIMNSWLSSYGDTFANVGLHYNEFHVLDTNGVTTEKASCADAASKAMAAIADLVEMPTVTCVNWATWRDNGEGLNMVGNKNGERYAVYHAIAVYNDLPVDRVSTTEDKYISCMAAANDDYAGIILYTRSTKNKPVTVEMNNLPYQGNVNVYVYAIDREHSSVLDGCESDELACIEVIENVPAEGLSWTGRIAPRGIVYIRIVPVGGEPEKLPVWSIVNGASIAGGTASVLKKEYYFEDRGTTRFSEFDLGTFTAWAGMGGEDKGTAKGSVILGELPASLTVTPAFYRNGSFGMNAYLVATYMDRDGNEIMACRFTCGENENVGTEFEEGGEIRLVTPEGFDGVLRLEYGIHDSGRNAAVKFKVRKGE